jgi:uncharacterized membrane protein
VDGLVVLACRRELNMPSVIMAFTEMVAVSCELISVLLIAGGAAEALTRLARLGPAVWRTAHAKKNVWLGFAAWLVLSLEFTLAADVVRTAVAPTWDAIGKLAVIAVVRTLLNFFLTRDLERAEKSPPA